MKIIPTGDIHDREKEPRHEDDGSGHKPFYTAEDVSHLSYDEDLGNPGEFPYTRGLYPSMYQGKLWTIRQFSGYGTPLETNQRFRFLLEQGQTGLSVAFDLPTLMGLDSDHVLAEGEVGKCGVAIDSLRDMEILFDGIPLDRVTTSMTINAPAAVFIAMYAALAEKQGVRLEHVRGTIQNDILKEFIAQKEWIYPLRPSLRLVVDSIGFCAEHLPSYNSISISGYHIREAGSTAVQELAFTLRNGIEYVESCLRRGLQVDDFAPRLSFFFDSHSRFFEETAKFRAARRIWARVMRDRFEARNSRSWMCRFHTHTAGCTLTAREPLNNVVRTTLQALAAVLGGTNSLHTNSLDEALALPTEEAARIALRTQQILAHETNIPSVPDPLGGSFLVETLTDEMELGTLDYFTRIDSLGGMVEAIDQGFPQKEIQEAAYRHQMEVEKGDRPVVGVNLFASEESPPLTTLEIGPEARSRQIAGLQRLRAARNTRKVGDRLAELGRAARSDANLMPYLIDAVKEYATLGEICGSLERVFGRYQEPIY